MEHPGSQSFRGTARAAGIHEASPHPHCLTVSPRLPFSSTVADDEIIDLTDEPSDPPVEVPCRWNCFHSGTLDVPLVLSYKAPSFARDDTGISGAESDIRQYNDSRRMSIPNAQGSRGGYRDQQQQGVETYATHPRDEIPSTTAFIPDREIFQLPLESHDKPRRILRTHDSSFITVTMYGFIERVHEMNSPKRRQALASPDLFLEEHVDDACLVLPGLETSVLVLAHAREDIQLMYLRVKDCHVSHLCQYHVFPPK